MRYAVLLTLALGGCAFSKVPLTLPRSAGTGLTGGDGREIVVVRPFKDERRERARCGMQKNSYGTDTADAVCSEDPAAWIAGLLATELQQAGFSVVDQATKPGTVRVDGTLLQIFVEPVIGFSTISLETDLHVRLVLTSPQGLEAERSFFRKGTASGIAATAATFQLSLDDAARQLTKNMVAEILSLMNRYPQLGLRERVLVLRTEARG